MKSITLLAECLVFIVAIAIAPHAEASLIYNGGGYSQNFDSLLSAPSSTNHAWSDNGTLAGWFSNRTTYRSSNGSDNTGSLYSFGTTSATDRALGSIASGGTGTILFGLRLQNNTASTFNEFTVTYDGEQWRNGGNTTNHTLAFDYQIGAGLTITAGSYTLVPSLNFTGPIATATAGALAGNDAANRAAGITYTVTGINWAPGQELFLRWSDPNDGGNDHGLGVDNFSFLANAIPEPASAAWFGMILVGGTLIRRRR